MKTTLMSTTLLFRILAESLHKSCARRFFISLHRLRKTLNLVRLAKNFCNAMRAMMSGFWITLCSHRRNMNSRFQTWTDLAILLAESMRLLSAHFCRACFTSSGKHLGNVARNTRSYAIRHGLMWQLKRQNYWKVMSGYCFHIHTIVLSWVSWFWSVLQN